jgi:hypothetical protein
MIQRSVVAAAALLLVGGCVQRPGSDDRAEAKAPYARSCSAAPAGWMNPGDRPGDFPLWEHLLINRIRIEADSSLRWNGDPVTRSALRAYLARIPDLETPMAVVLRVHGSADCTIVRTIRQDMEELLRCRSSRLCGEGDGR